MNEKLERLVGAFQLSDAPTGEPARSWIQVLVEGDFKHPVSGAFKVTAADLSGFAGDIQARAGEIALDFDHESASPTGSTRAAGWYTGQTRIDDDDEGRRALFAEVEWTPAGAASVASKEYRFVSPEFGWQWRDATGKIVKGYRMFATALTNRPFLPRMQPLALSEFGVRELGVAIRSLLLADGDRIVWNPNDGMQSLLERVSAEVPAAPDGYARFWVMDVASKKALLQEHGTGETFVAPFTVSRGVVKLSPEEEWTRATQEWVRAAAAFVRGDSLALDDRPDPDPSIDHDEGDPEMDTSKLAEALGLSADADETAILAAARAVRETAEKAPRVDDEVVARFLASDNPGDSLRQLLASAAKGEEAAKRLHEMERDTLLASAVSNGKILPAQKDGFAAMYDLDPENVRQLLAATPERSFAPASSGDDAAAEPELAKVAASFSTDDDAADLDSVRLHVKAESILAAAGKPAGQYSYDEYVQALETARISA